MICICMIIYCWAKFDSLIAQNKVDNLIQAKCIFFIYKLALLLIQAYPQILIFFHKKTFFKCKKNSYKYVYFQYLKVVQDIS